MESDANLRRCDADGMSVVPFHPSCGPTSGSDGLVNFWFACASINPDKAHVRNADYALDLQKNAIGSMKLSIRRWRFQVE